MPVISYPIPIYANVPIHAEYYTPKRFVIEDVQLGQTTIVTTVLDHDYVIGQQVRLIIPSNFGCYQLNKVKGYVISVPSSDQVEVDINSLRNVDAFVSATVSIAYPQILAIGDINEGAINSQGRRNNITYIPGSFRDISPQ